MRKIVVYITLSIMLVACDPTTGNNISTQEVFPTDTISTVETKAAPLASAPPTDFPIEELFEKSNTQFPRKSTFQVALGDIDGDGDLDAVFANFRRNHGAVWFNQGDGTFIDSGQELTTLGHSITMGDLDGDEDLDVIIVTVEFGQSGTYYSTNSKVYLNDGDGLFSENGQFIDDEEKSGIVVWLYDIDLDSDLDALVEYAGETNFSFPNTVYINNGAGLFEDTGVTYPKFSGLGDLDGDGDLDAFAKIMGEGYVAYLNDGDEEFEKHWEMEASNVIRGDVVLADFDNDGDLDAIVANGDRDAQYPPTFLFNNGNGDFEIVDAGTNEMTLLDYATAVDLNQDGYLDLVITNIFYDNEIWFNDGNGYFTFVDASRYPSFAAANSSGRVTVGDVNNDGKLDLFVSSWEQRPILWLNDTP